MGSSSRVLGGLLWRSAGCRALLQSPSVAVRIAEEDEGVLVCASPLDPDAARRPCAGPAGLMGVNPNLLAKHLCELEGLNASYELRMGEDVFRAEVADERLEIERGSAERLEVSLETDAGTLGALWSTMGAAISQMPCARVR